MTIKGRNISSKYILIVLVGIVLLAIVFGKCSSTKSIINEQYLVDSTELKQVHLKYGIPIDDFDVETEKVKKNQSLSTILDKYGIYPDKVYEISKKAKDVFNVKGIRTGHSYTILKSRDSVPKPEYFIYENTDLEYIVFDLQEDINVYKGEKSVVKKQKSVSGKIESSLWNAMVSCGADPLLAVNLSEIYAWSIDFFGIAKGDSFKVLYNEDFVGGKSLRIFNIKAAVFNHRGKEYYAFPYLQDGKMGYFDEHGANLQKAFLKAPLKFSRISSRFSNRRFHPVLKRYRAHHGVDYAAATGTPIHSIGDGRIIKKAYQKGGGGRYIKIKHNSIYSTCYMHMSRYAKGMRAGVRVKQGQIIGYVGQSGIATGPHLDFRIYKNGRPVNPLKIKSPPKLSIKKVNKEEYVVYSNLLEEQLKEI